MAVSSQKFQAPKGTRDFYPADLAARRHIENVWRQVSINHGFEEIDGPTFEHLDLYTHKSGPGIASELFQVMSGKDEEQIAAIRAGGAAPYALRPEFTPTLARMVAAKAAELPRPIKWFAIPSHFRAERPQRGRLREFMQWNVDFIGDESPRIDAELLACCVDALQSLGLDSASVTIKFSDRVIIQAMLEAIGIPSANIADWLTWIDKRDSLDATKRVAAAEGFGGTQAQAVQIEHLLSGLNPEVHRKAKETLIAQGQQSRVEQIEDAAQNLIQESLRPSQRRMKEFLEWLEVLGISEWCTFDSGIVRGLAYYSGLVFEVHEATGAERAIAGGGRYDNLIESFGGPKLPACGFGMGDVVLANILRDKGRLKPSEEYLPRPDAFVIAADDDAAAKLPAIVASLRKENLHVRQSYKTTRNVGKLLADASKCRARFAVIIGTKFADNIVELKDMDGGEPHEVRVDELAAALRPNP